MGRKNKRRQEVYTRRLRICPKQVISHNRHNRSTPQRGDIWFADLGLHLGTSIQGGCRPVIIISNNIGNQHAETVNVLPMTRHLKKPELPCHTLLDPTVVTDKQQILDPSMVLVEQVTTIDKSQLRNYAGRITDDTIMSRVNQAISGQLSLTEKL